MIFRRLESFRKIFKKTLLLESIEYKIATLNSQPVIRFNEGLYHRQFLVKFSKIAAFNVLRFLTIKISFGTLF